MFFIKHTFHVFYNILITGAATLPFSTQSPQGATSTPISPILQGGATTTPLLQGATATTPLLQSVSNVSSPAFVSAFQPSTTGANMVLPNSVENSER